MLNYLFESSSYEFKNGVMVLLNARTKVMLGGMIKANRWFSYVEVDFHHGSMRLHQGEGVTVLALTFMYQLIESEVEADVVMGKGS